VQSPEHQREKQSRRRKKVPKIISTLKSDLKNEIGEGGGGGDLSAGF